jgi:N-carbamoylputrescine amidase
MKDLKIAAVCMKSLPRKIDRNLDRIESFVQEASERGVSIICFPELSITGYIHENPHNIYSLNQSGEIIERVIRMARTEGLIIIVGMIEMTDGLKPYISQVVASPDGLLGIYRKTHLSPQEKESFGAGEKLDVFKNRDITFGVQLCYEAHFPEISTVMALKGADIIFMPHASPRGTPEEKMQSWLRHLTSRAFDNGLYVVACNQVGETREGLSFPGVAIGLNPAGGVIARYGGNQEKMLLVDLRQSELWEIREHRMRYFIPNRRSELYKDLTSSSSQPVSKKIC